MKYFNAIVTCLFLSCFFYSETNAQPPDDSAAYKQSISNVLAFYKTTLAENQHLYNGTEYATQGHNVKGFPYFGSDSLLTGNIFYDDQLYRNIKMHYDLVTGEVAINDYTQNFLIRLITEKIDYFSVLDHLFVYIVPDKAQAASVSPGFYDKLFSGNISLFAKREKKLQLSVNAADNDAKYSSYTNYFILVADTFYPVENQRAVLDLVKDKKDEVKKYIKANKLNFKKDPENTLVKTVAYYNQLIN